MRIYAALLTVFSIALLLSCDSSENWDEKRSQELSKVFCDETLVMTYNNQEVYHKAVKFYTHDLNTAQLDIRYLIPGESPLEIKDVLLKEEKNNPGTYTFQTSVSNNNREIDITGHVGDKLQLDVQLKVTSPLAGIWSPATSSELQGPLEFEIVPGSGSQTINMYGILGLKEIPLVGGFDVLIRQMGGLIFGIIQISLDLNEDSELIAHWKVLFGTPSQSDEGMVQYNVVNDHVFAAVAIDKLLAGSLQTRNVTASHIEIMIELLQKIYQGIPFQLVFSDNDEKVRVSITKEMIVPYLDMLMEVLGPQLAEVDLGAIGLMLGITKENLPLFAGELIRVIKESNEFKIHFNLERTTQPVKLENSPATMLQLTNHIGQLKSDLNLRP